MTTRDGFIYINTSTSFELNSSDGGAVKCYYSFADQQNSKQSFTSAQAESAVLSPACRVTCDYGFVSHDSLQVAWTQFVEGVIRGSEQSEVTRLIQLVHHAGSQSCSLRDETHGSLAHSVCTLMHS